MLKKIIILIILVTISGTTLYIINEKNKEIEKLEHLKNKEIEKVENLKKDLKAEQFEREILKENSNIKTFVDENKIKNLISKEEIKSIKEKYRKKSKEIENKKLPPEDRNKENLIILIEYINSLGFKVDQNRENVQILQYVKNSETFSTYPNDKEKLREIEQLSDLTKYSSFEGYTYEYILLDFDLLMKLNKYSEKNYKLKLPNPIGFDFIVYYDHMSKKEKIKEGEYRILNRDLTKELSGEPDGVLLDISPDSLGVNVLGYSHLNYNKSKFYFRYYVNESKYSKNLNFSYSKKENNTIKLEINLNPYTQKQHVMHTKPRLDPMEGDWCGSY